MAEIYGHSWYARNPDWHESLATVRTVSPPDRAVMAAEAEAAAHRERASSDEPDEPDEPVGSQRDGPGAAAQPQGASAARTSAEPAVAGRPDEPVQPRG